MGVDYDQAFVRADRLRDNAQTLEAIAVYTDLAVLTQQEAPLLSARAWHGAGLAVNATIGVGEASKFQKATGYFGQAITIYSAEGDVLGQGKALRDLAIAADHLGDFPVALEAFQRSIELLGGLEEVAELAIAYDKLGLHFVRAGQPAQALPHMNKAIELLRQAPTEGFYWATTLFDRATAYFYTKDFSKALADAEQAFSWFEADHGEDTYNQRRCQVSALLGQIYRCQGSDKESQAYTKMFYRLLTGLDKDVAASLTKQYEKLSAIV